MELPCEDCKHRTVRRNGHREFIGCKDPERKKRGFIEDDFTYNHKCTEYEKEKENENTNQS